MYDLHGKEGLYNQCLTQDMLNCDPSGLEPVNQWDIHLYNIDSPS